MIKTFSFLVIGFLLLFVVPLCIGIVGGMFGLIFGVIGLVFGLIGFILKSIAWIFSSITHLLFGWHTEFGFHEWHWHFNGYVLAALIILIIAISQRKK